MAKLKKVSSNISKNVEKPKDLTEEQVENQEHLNKERFESLKPKFSWDDTDRPKSNLVDLMHWALNKFRNQAFNTSIDNINKLQCYIHNKVVIDGSFMQFCEQIGAKIECLYRDSIASWKSEHNYEHFMAQGIFKIIFEGTEFLHCALFHKGNQNEDEVSFFIICHDDHFAKYVEFRNKYDKWLVDRDREHLEIHVVGGEGYSYTRDANWDDLFLPDALKNDIKQSIEGFLASKDFYEKCKIPWRRGVLLWGTPGNGKSSCVRTIISQYNFKPVTVQSGAQTNDDTITEAFAYAEEQGPSLLYIEDLDTLLGTQVTLSHFLQMMDGVSAKGGIMVIATANDISRLKESVTDRPSRFDRKWEIPLPDEKMAKKYLQKWFGDSLSDKEYAGIVKSAVDSHFSYAYLKELYLTSMFNAMAAERDKPTVADIKAATKQLTTDKEVFNQGFELAQRETLQIL